MRRILFCALLLCAVALPGAADERVLRFDGTVNVLADGDLLIRERIEVRAEGNEIRHGIYRDFPTTYIVPGSQKSGFLPFLLGESAGKRVHVAFDVQRVLLDGEPAPHFESGNEGNVRLYIGEKDALVPPGRHVYEIFYRTDRQIGFFPDHDELYWNVTGNEWVFPIDAASCTVVLPEGTRVLSADAWTGIRGSTERAAEIGRDDAGNALFRTTRRLGAGEGLTVAVAWPKNVVAPLSTTAMIWRDRRLEILSVLSCLALAAYFLVVWFRFGRDPKKGAIVPLFAPPENLSPAAVRFISRMGFDDKAFAAALLSLAVKGHVRIVEASGYLLKRIGEGQPRLLPDEERSLLSALFARRKELLLDNANHAIVGSARDDLRKLLASKYEGPLFHTNLGWTIGGVVLAIFLELTTLFFGTFVSVDMIPGIFAFIWMAVASTFGILLVRKAIATFAGAHGLKGCFAVLRGALKGIFGLILLLVSFGCFAALAAFYSLLAAIWMSAVATLPAIFYPLLKAPTVEGRRLMDKIDGFALYLGVAERDRLNLMNPPERTPEVFERYLPYALALDVEQQWAEQFADVLEAAEREGHAPSWYDSSRSTWWAGTAGIAALGTSLAGAAAAAAVAPGSSSGFSGGGGSSGGGGGGGGGGGW